ncbi:MAG: protease pro-enzyme activation domain-containing protein, partial [Candidatus Dormibacteraceae bacterium]
MVVSACVPLLMMGAVIPAGADTPGWVMLKGTRTPPPPGATDRGQAPGNTAMDMQVLLNTRDPQGLAAAARAVSEPTSPGYSHYHTPEQVKNAYQLTLDQLAPVKAWLAGSGLQISDSGNWRYLDVKGTATQIEIAFHVQVHIYLSPEAKYTGQFIAFTTDLSVPTTVSRLVLNIRSGDSTMGNGMASLSQASTPSATQCSTYWGQNLATTLPKAYGHTPPYAVCGYTPQQLRDAYGITPTGLTGKGQTVAVVEDEASTMEQDVNTWTTHTGTQPLAAGQLTVLSATGTPNPKRQDPTNENTGEGIIDVEAMHGMA